MERTEIIVFKHCNTALGSKLDALRKDCKSAAQQREVLQRVASNYELLFSHFLGAWHAVLGKFQALGALASDSSENWLRPKFDGLLAQFSEVVALSEKTRGADPADFGKQARVKTETFVRGFENLYTEF